VNWPVSSLSLRPRTAAIKVLDRPFEPEALADCRFSS
jgi:hypothetical protein